MWWGGGKSPDYVCCFLRDSITCEYVSIVGGCKDVKYFSRKECLAAEVSCWCFLWILWAKLAKQKVTEYHSKIKNK